MRKTILSVVATLALLTATVAPVSAMENSPKFAVNLNGVDVGDMNAHIMNDRTYVSVGLFANRYAATYEYNDASKTLTINGQTVSNQYGAPHMDNGVVVASLRAMAETLGTDHFSIGWDNDGSSVNVTILPKGVIPLDGHFVVPKMGEHWADPANLPLGPIYGLYHGKLVFLEYMPDKDLDKTVHDIPGTTVPIPAKIDHVDIDWNPNGHPGDLNPHYDVHLYFITRAEQDKIS